MSRNIQLALKYLQRSIDRPLSSCKPLPISGMQVIEILWPLNELFRPRIEIIRVVEYDPRYERKANDAIELFAYHGAKQWTNLHLATWRVLLERHEQALVVSIANEKAGNHIISLPECCPSEARLGCVMLFLLHSMVLPLPPTDKSHFELPEGDPASFFSQN
jgi:hypothetical protein